MNGIKNDDFVGLIVNDTHEEDQIAKDNSKEDVEMMITVKYV